MDIKGTVNVLFPHLYEFHCIEICVLDILNKDDKGYPTAFNTKFLIIGKDGSISLSNKKITQSEWIGRQRTS